MSEAKGNKIKNEEFKIWKKSVPSLYQHITTIKPSYTRLFEGAERIPKVVAFTHKIVPDREKGTFTTSLLCSQGSDIYEVDFQLPLGLHSNSEALPDPQYSSAFAEIVHSEKHEPKWTYQGNTIIKLEYVGGAEADAIAMTSTGSLAWFKDGCKVPVYVMEELVGPATSFSRIHNQGSTNNWIAADFAVSENTETVVKSQQSMATGPGEEHSLLKIVDNSQSPGNLIRTISIPGVSVTQSIKFHDNNMFSTCSDDNGIRFYDIRGDGKPLWTVFEPHDGKLTCYDVSPTLETLFITGSDTGVLKLWDLRSVIACEIEQKEPTEIAKLYHSGADPVADVRFGISSPTEVLSVGDSGNVYHWNLEPIFLREGDEDDEMAESEELQQQCLEFMHTGGGRRSLGQSRKRETVAWHPIVQGVVGCVDPDGLLTVYRGHYGATDKARAQDEREDNE